MAFVDRKIHRFTHSAPGVMERRRHVGQLHEIVKVFEGRVSTSLIETADERRSVGRGEDGMRSTDAHVARRVARVLHEFGGRRALNQRAAEPARKADALAVDRRSRVFPDREGFRVVAKIDPRLFEDGFRILLDGLEALFAQRLVGEQLAGQVGDDWSNGVRAGGSARFATSSTRTRSTGFAHTHLPFEHVPGAESKELVGTRYIANI
jgi:hypothetical protein